MDAAFKVFAEHGIAAGTIDQIAEAAGYTKGAFYSNFASKEELFILVTERFYRDLLVSIRQRAEKDLVSGTPVDGLTVDTLGPLILGMMRDLHDERAQQLLRLEATQLALRDPNLRTRYLDVRNKALDELGRVLGAAVIRMRRQLVLPEGEAIRVLLDVYEGRLTDQLLHDVSSEEIAERLHRQLAAVLLGITAPSQAKDV